MSSFEGGLNCKDCNIGTFVRNGSGQSIEQCQVCPEGTNQTMAAGFRACVCKHGYTRNNRFKSCELCQEEGLNCTFHEYKALLPGYYWNWSFPTANLDEYQSFAKNLEDESRFYENQFINYSKEIPKIYKCPRSASCVNHMSYTSKGISGSCGYGYTGWLCSKCKEGFFMVLNTCVVCPEKMWLIAEVFLVLILCLLFYLFALWQYKREQRLNANQRTILDTIVSRVKIILGCYQVVGEFFESLHDVSWAGGLQVIGEFISYIELNVMKVLVRPQCYDQNLNFNPKVEFIIGLALPVFIVVVACLCYFVYKGWSSYKSRAVHCQHIMQDNLSKLRTKLTTLVMVLLFVMYPSICTVIFQLLPRACKEFCLDHQNMHCFHLLRSDYEIQCESLSFYQYAAYIATGVHVVSFPCVLFYLLRKHCSINSQKSSRGMFIQEPLLQNVDENTPLLNDQSVQPAIPIWLNFLCENYKPQYWFWEILELTRKVTQTVLITLLGWEDKLTMLLTIGISVMFLTFHARFWPMKDAFDQRLQVMNIDYINQKRFS